MDRRIKQAFDHMRQHIRHHLDVDGLAKTAGLSASRFAHLFRQEVGRSPIDYLRNLRLELARALLDRTSLSVADVRARIGWPEPSHFARDFRRRFGFSPSDRRRALNTASTRTGVDKPHSEPLTRSRVAEPQNRQPRGRSGRRHSHLAESRRSRRATGRHARPLRSK